MNFAPRGLAERRRAVGDRLETDSQLWLATGSDGLGAHLIPVAYVWDGSELFTATFERSRTTTNVRSNPHARVAIGNTADVVMIDTVAHTVPVAEINSEVADRYARVSRDPRTASGFVYMRLAPQRVQVWRGLHEFAGRTVMLGGTWLEEAVD